jgi:Protein of unknown function (DUF732)
MYCVYCGRDIGGQTLCHDCGAYKVGSTWHRADTQSCSLPDSARDAKVAAAVMEQGSGWKLDPTGRHEGRYFVSGHPTDLIRDGTIEAVDLQGEQQLEHHALGYPADAAPPAKSRSRRRWLLVTIVGVILLVGSVGGVALGVLLGRKSPDEKYLAALRQSGLAGQFASDANAIAHGKQVCRTLGEGGPQQGLPVDKVAVNAYCPQFSKGFHVLETATITGTFTLADNSPDAYYPTITNNGSTCSGADGWSDIHPGTQLFVKNSKGDIVATTELEQGTGNRFVCRLPFSFEITEGEDHYIVSVGRRGEVSYTFTQLKNDGVKLCMGSCTPP